MPKILFLVRHAKSSWIQPGLLDFDRTLNLRGQQDAPEMGRRLKEKNVVPQIVLCSPARRAVQTLDLMNKVMNIPSDSIFMQKRIYEASPETLLNLIQHLDDAYDSAMLVGHNPSMTWLASQLSNSYIQNLPTCSIVTITLDSNHWIKAGKCPAELQNLDSPKNEV